MEDEVKTTEITVEEPVGTSARQELEALLLEILPEEKQTGDVDQMALDWIREQREMNNRIADKLSEEPELAQILVEVVNGGTAARSLVRHLGRDFINAEEGTPEYDEMMAADNEFRAERESIREKKAEFDTKAAAFFTAFRDYCEKNNLVYEEYLGKIMEKLLGPVMSWEATDEVFDRLVKAVDYEKDTEDAFVAGETKGRNTNIYEMRMKPSDGMPKGLSSQAAPVEQPKRRMNSLIAKALNA